MMQALLYPKKIPLNKNFHFQIPSSKSLTNRALLLSALAKGTSYLKNILLSEDTLAMLLALQKLGVLFELDKKNKTCKIDGCVGQIPNKNTEIDCKDAGTIARFLTAVLATQDGNYKIYGGKQLSSRPMKGLLDVLKKQNVNFVAPNNSLPINLVGHPWQGGCYLVDASESGQFASGLLMALPLMAKSSRLHVISAVNPSFIHMTTQLMKVFGVNVKQELSDKIDDACDITSGSLMFDVDPQTYTSCDYTIEPDLSTAAPFFAASIVSSRQVSLTHPNFFHSLQGDRQFLKIIERMGAQVRIFNNQIIVNPGTDFLGIDVDMNDCSDTFMALAAIAPFAKTPTTIFNIGHVRLQESDRIKAMCMGLRKLNISVQEKKDGIKIFPGVPQAGLIDTFRDHRIAMAFSILGLKTKIILNNYECVSKTCPNFFSLWEEMCHVQL